MNSQRFYKILVLVAVGITLAGCSGIPFSTLWHFRNFGPKDFLQTNPATLRVAIQLRDGVNLGDKPPELGVNVKFAGESVQKFSMPLVVLKEGPWVGAGTGKANAGKHWYLLALAATGIEAYRNLQQELNRHVDASGQLEKHGNLTISVQTNKLRFSKIAQKRLLKDGHLFLQSRLELSPQGGFYTLYKGEIPLNNPSNAASKRTP